MMDDQVIVTKDLTKVYTMGEVKVHALRGVSFNIRRGEVVSIMGPSGSGKSTVMNILGCLDRPTSGEYFLDGERVSELSDDELSIIRNRKVGLCVSELHVAAAANRPCKCGAAVALCGSWERPERAGKSHSRIGRIGYKAPPPTDRTFRRPAAACGSRPGPGK